MIDYAAEYDNSARVGNSAALIEQYAVDAERFRDHKSLVADFNMAYGPSPRNQLDIFWPRNKAGKEHTSPLVMFIHGGYWQRMDRTSFSHMAKGLNQNGIAVAMPSYTLCPDIKIDGIINEVRRACLALYQTHQRKITVVGHSAGGHLAACAMATDWEQINRDLPPDMVCSGMGISGIYDLVPLLYTPINDALRMDRKQAIDASPIRWLPEALQRFEAWVGEHESDEYHRQSRELADRWTMLGTPTKYVSAKRANHFTIINDLTDPESQMVGTIVDLVQNPGAEVKIKEPREKAIQAMLQDFARLPVEPVPEKPVAIAISEDARPTKPDSQQTKSDQLEEIPQLTGETGTADQSAETQEPAAEQEPKAKPKDEQYDADKAKGEPDEKESTPPPKQDRNVETNQSQAKQSEVEPDTKSDPEPPAAKAKTGTAKPAARKTPAGKTAAKKAPAKRKRTKKMPKSIVTRKRASNSKKSTRKKPAEKSKAEQKKTTSPKET